MRVINYEKIFINERIRDIISSKKGQIILYTDGGNLVILKKELKLKKKFLTLKKITFFFKTNFHPYH